jgi:hypothetical protein
VCAAINAHDRERNEGDTVLRRRVAKVNSALDARDAIHEGVEKVQRNAEHDLAMFTGLEAPAALRATAASTTTIWQRTLNRLGAYAHRLDVAGSSQEVQAAVNFNARLRAAMSRDVTAERAGLIRLGGGVCQLDPPLVSRAIRIRGDGPDVGVRAPREHGLRRSGPDVGGNRATHPVPGSAAPVVQDRSPMRPNPSSPDVRTTPPNDMVAPADSGSARTHFGANVE